jgi:hypothetical protein
MLSARRLWLVSVLALAVEPRVLIAQPVACTARQYSHDEIYSAISFSTVAPSSLWCGNRYRRNDRTNESGGRVAADLSGPCRSLATYDAQRGLAPPTRSVPAVERTEVRGWLRTEPYSMWLDGEVLFELEPDIDWTPAPGSAIQFALNTPALLAERLTPFNNGLIHVEMNHWEAGRLCGVSRNEIGGEGQYEQAWRHFMERGRLCRSYRDLRPADWCFLNDFIRGPGVDVFAPYDWNHPPRDPALPDNGPLRVGDYVRIVGTLWEDWDHGVGSCWNHASRRAHVEIHPVDFIARIPAPLGPGGVPRARSGVGSGGACVGPNVLPEEALVAFVVAPSVPRPGPNWSLRTEEIINPFFTDRRSIVPQSEVASGPTGISNDALHVRMTVRSRGGWQGQGRYWAAWRAWWEEGPCTSCSASQRCFQGACCTPTCGRGCGGAVVPCGANEYCERDVCVPSSRVRVPCRCVGNRRRDDLTCDDPQCRVFCTPAGGRDCDDTPEVHPSNSCEGRTCPAGQSCVGGHCVCAPQCQGRICGDDRCGSVCGPCPARTECNATGTCCRACVGRQCGRDGCGGTCGSCSRDERCTVSGRCVPNDTRACVCADLTPLPGKHCGEASCLGVCRQRHQGGGQCAPIP